MTESNRRQYFRRNDLVCLRFQEIDFDPSQSACSYFYTSQTEHLKRELLAIEQEQSRVIREIAANNEELARYLRLMQRKIALIAQQIKPSDDTPDPIMLNASLSEGGVSFENPLPLVLGQYLAIELILQPEQTLITTYAKCVSCQAHTDKFRVGLEFVDLDETDRQNIVKRLLQLDAKALRQRKQLD